MAAQNKNPKKYKRNTKTIVNTNHKTTDNMAAAMLSPITGGSKSKLPTVGALSE